MPPRLDVEAVDRPTVIYILYSMMSAQQTNLLHENASQKCDFSQKSISHISDYLVMLKFLWLCNHHITYIHYIQPTAYQLYMQCYKFNS